MTQKFCRHCVGYDTTTDVEPKANLAEAIAAIGRARAAPSWQLLQSGPSSYAGWLDDAFVSNHLAQDHANIEITKVLAPICYRQFNQQPDAAAKMTELKGLSLSASHFCGENWSCGDARER